MIKSQRAKTAHDAANWLVLTAPPNSDTQLAAVWAGRFDILKQYAGYLSAQQIDTHISQANDLLPGFSDRYKELSQ